MHPPFAPAKMKGTSPDIVGSSLGSPPYSRPVEKESSGVAEPDVVKDPSSVQDRRCGLAADLGAAALVDGRPGLDRRLVLSALLKTNRPLKSQQESKNRFHVVFWSVLCLWPVTPFTLPHYLWNPVLDLVRLWCTEFRLGNSI